MEITHFYCTNLANSSARLAFLFEGSQLRIINAVCQGSGVKLQNFRKDMVLMSLSVNQHSFLYNTFNEVMEKIVPAGIPQYLYKFHQEQMYKIYEPEADGSPKVLTFDDLSFGFVLWLGTCGVSLAGFLLELVGLVIRKFFEYTIGLNYFLRSLERKLEMMPF